MTKTYSIWSSVSITCLLAVACTQDAPRGALPAAEASLESALRLERTVVLPDTGITGVVRLAGAALLGDSLLAVADPSNSRMIVVDLQSGKVMPLGSTGTGPGEFRLPVTPKFDREGLLHILDPMQRKIHVYDAGQRRHVRTAVIGPDIGGIFDFALLDSGRYVIAGSLPADRGRGIVVFDSLGTKVSSWVLSLHRHPGNSPDSELWGILSRLNVVARADSIWVTQPLLDTVWVATIGAGEVGRFGVSAPGYVTPALPEVEPTDRRQATEWYERMLLPHGLAATSDRLYVGFARGIYNDGAPGVLLSSTDHRNWIAITNPPPIIGVGGARLVMALSGDSLPVRLGIYSQIADSSR